MQNILRTIPNFSLYDSESAVFTEHALFVDIETTGFSARNARVYLIGMAYRKGSDLYIRQLMADSSDEEARLLDEFSAFLTDHSCLISFNGIGFDLPFLEERARKFGLPLSFSGMQLIDLYKTALSLKKLLGLVSYRQKALETFLGIRREDCMDGGQLIEVYRNYCRQPDREALNLLLLHNYEDVLGMTALLSLFRCQKALKGPSGPVRFEVISEEGTGGFSLLLTFPLAEPLPVPLHTSCERILLDLQEVTGQLILPVCKGELYYFFADYKDYIYLPLEDRAIHKSLAAFVDKDHREKCHPYNCYMRKEGVFLPQLYAWKKPCYLRHYKDSVSWFELEREMLSDQEFLGEYIRQIMNWML